MTTLLCIDDNRFELAIRKRMFETQGYSVLTADNGASGLQLLFDNPVDAVVLDYQMAGMDGLAVATAIRERHGKLPIVLLSGYPIEIPEPLLQIVDAFVPKGHYPPQALLEQVRRVIKKPPMNDIPARPKNSAGIAI